MPTTIIPEITEKSPWWIPRQRYYELKHFCLQYQDWKTQIRMFDGVQHQAAYTNMPKNTLNDISDPTARNAEKRLKLQSKIDMVEHAAAWAGADLSNYILKGITEGITFSILQCKLMIPCNRNEYYDRYRKFFWILDQLRE